MRNGVIADTLRKAGSPYHIIFGLNLPQIREIASQFEPSADLATQLWNDVRTRESALLAPWLIPDRRLSADEAAEWILSATSSEALDILCMACLRGAAYAPDLALKLSRSRQELERYASLRLMLGNLKSDTIDVARMVVSAVTDKDSLILKRLAAQLTEEISFLS